MRGDSTTDFTDRRIRKYYEQLYTIKLYKPDETDKFLETQPTHTES